MTVLEGGAFLLASLQCRFLFSKIKKEKKKKKKKRPDYPTSELLVPLGPAAAGTEQVTCS